VRLVREPLASWQVSFRLDPSPWPAPSLRVRLRWSFGDGARDAEDEAVGEGEPVSVVSNAAQSGPQGPARLTWSGGGIAPGEVRTTLKAGEANRSEVVLRYDPRGDVGTDLVLDASALAGDAPNPTAVGWGGPWPAGSAPDADRLPYVRRETANGRRHTLGAVWRETEGLMAFAGDWVARPQAPPTSGTWRPPFERGGQVAVVVDPTPDPALGALLVRRSDGLPLLATMPSDGAPRPAGAGGDGAVEPRHEIAVVPGTILGPFPPGDVALEARLGAVPLAPATVRVRAGRVTTWEVRWRAQ
jgi:hypothetical protein